MWREERHINIIDICMYREKTTYTSYIYIYVYVRIYASFAGTKGGGDSASPAIYGILTEL